MVILSHINSLALPQQVYDAWTAHAVLNGFTTYDEACLSLMAYRVTRLKLPQHS
jgi:hypothetical protein